MPNARLLENTTTLLDGWRAFNIERPTYGSERSRRIGFHRYVARETRIGLDSATARVVFCLYCSLPALASLAHPAQGGMVCDSCVARYSHCANCDELTLTSTHVPTLAQTMICARCATREFLYCHTCRGYYRKRYRTDHRHGTRSCCCSEERTFTVPHVGDDPLQNDVQVHVSLPSGEISDEGIEQIRAQLGHQGYYTTYNERVMWRRLQQTIDELGPQWQTKQGNWPKRLSSLAYKKYKLKIPPELMTLIGNIARDNSHGVDFNVEVTRELNRGARAFGYSGSCWWQSYSRSRCTLKTNGGFALRTFDENGVTGRAWVMPLKSDVDRLIPTYETMTPAAYVLFNGYGKLTGYAAPRVLSHMTGWTYRKIQYTCGPMYINSSAGFLVAPEELAKDYTDGQLNIEASQHSMLFQREKRVLLHV